jgi:hypothetical protein
VSSELIIALRDIEAGEQVAYDYAFTETEASFHAGMQCGCGGASCRGEALLWRVPLARLCAQVASVSLAAHQGSCRGALVVRSSRLSLQDRSARRRVWPPHARADRPWRGRARFAGKVILDKFAIDPAQSDERGQELSLQVHDHLYQVPIGVFRGTSAQDVGVEVPDLINHSCDANCGQLDSVTLVAMRDIAAGEQLTFDYAMSSTAPGLVVDAFDCLCGTKNCRGRVQPGDWKRTEIQNRYWPYFAPHMKARILALRPDLAAASGGELPTGIKHVNGVAAHANVHTNGMEVNGH